MTTFTYVTVSYYYVGVGYPRVGYGGEGYPFVAVAYRRVAYGAVGIVTAPCILRVGNLRCRMVAGNVVKDTPLGLDTGGGG